MDDEVDGLTTFLGRLSKTGDVKDLTLGQFSGAGLGRDRINLSTLHSAKGREFTVVLLFAMDRGKIPWNNVTTERLLESRRLFYVGFTRARTELHIAYTRGEPSPFVLEVENRLQSA
jgi:superfamily I DNA/RNA helicase